MISFTQGELLEQDKLSKFMLKYAIISITDIYYFNIGPTEPKMTYCERQITNVKYRFLLSCQRFLLFNF